MSSVHHHTRCLCSGNTGFAPSGTEPKYERARPFSIDHLGLDLRLDIAGKAVAGTASLDITRVDPGARRLVLDAVGFEDVRVRLEVGGRARPTRHVYDGDRIEIELPARLQRGRVHVSYRATPRRGLYFLAPDEHVPDRPEQVWSQCQDEDARHWFPCHDKPHAKMTTELKVQVPHGFTALSNGELVARSTPKSKRSAWTFHYALKQPHPSYLVSLVVGRFSCLEDGSVPRRAPRGAKGPSGDIPIRYYVPAGREEDGRRSFEQTPKMMELFQRLTGTPFPWPSYAQVVVSDFVFGGMENTTLTTMYEHVLLDERAALDITSHDLVAHELAHQWFGNYVTCRDWSHAWLNEGFATFFEHLEREARLGRDEYDYGIQADFDAYLGEANGRYQRPIVCRTYKEPIELFDRHLYEKGGQVLHMLRRQLGDETFFQGVAEYLSTHGGGIVETSDLQRALERVSGRSLDRFFDQWLFHPGHPVLKVQIAHAGRQLEVSIQQTQKPDRAPIFAFDAEVAVSVRGKVQRYKKLVTTNKDALVIPCPERPDWVVFDPDQAVRAELTLEAPGDLLRQQLAHAPSAHGRWSAAVALGRRSDAPTIAALSRSLKDSKEAWMVRVEAARALGKVRGEQSLAALREGAAADHPKVRRAVVDALGAFRTEAAAAVLRDAALSDPSYLVAAAAARGLGRTRLPIALEPLTALLDRGSWADVVRVHALEGLAELGDDSTIAAVTERTRYGVPTRVRRAALLALAELDPGPKTRRLLEDHLDDADPFVRTDAIAALSALGDPKSRGALRRRLERELDGRVGRRLREALQSLSDGGNKDKKRLGAELEQVRAELAELRVRLSKLEGAKTSGRAATASGAPKRGKRSTSRPSVTAAPSRGRRSRSKLDERGPGRR